MLPPAVDPLPVAPEFEPLEPELPVALGLDVDPPAVLPLPVLWAHDAPAKPTSAAATAAVSVFAITFVYSLEVEWGETAAAEMQAGCRGPACALQVCLAVVPPALL